MGLYFVIVIMAGMPCADIIKITKSPKAAILEGKKNKLVTKIENPIGDIYYDDTQIWKMYCLRERISG